MLWVLFALLIVGCGHEKQMMTVSNPSDFERVDEPVIISRQQLAVREHENLLPCVKDENGVFLASQLDTILNKSDWDEMAFLVDLRAKEKKQLFIEWVAEADYPTFTNRTHIHLGILNQQTKEIEARTSFTLGKELFWKVQRTAYPFQMDGIAWENDKMGFRHYFDGRNCRDVFGKRTSEMVLDRVGIKPDGLPGDTYHTLADWGRDIHSCANSFGLGGVGLWSNDRFYRLGIEGSDTINIVDQTSFHMLAQGPVRTVFDIHYKGWQTPLGKINVSHKTTIWAGKIGYENELSCDELPDASYLMTGIVTNFNDQPTIEKVYGKKQFAMITHDKQSYDKEYFMGMALLLPEASVVKTFGLDEISTWCALLKPSSAKYLYNVYCTWEMQDIRSVDRNYFVGLIEKEANKISEPIEVIVK